MVKCTALFTQALITNVKQKKKLTRFFAEYQWRRVVFFLGGAGKIKSPTLKLLFNKDIVIQLH